MGIMKIWCVCVHGVGRVTLYWGLFFLVGWISKFFARGGIHSSSPSRENPVMYNNILEKQLHKFVENHEKTTL